MCVLSLIAIAGDPMFVVCFERKIIVRLRYGFTSIKLLRTYSPRSWSLSMLLNGLGKKISRKITNMMKNLIKMMNHSVLPNVMLRNPST